MTPAIRPEAANLSRRDFVKTFTAAALASSVSPAANPSPAETAVTRFYKSLNDDQKALICFPPDRPRRSRLGDNPAIVRPRIQDLNPVSQTLCREIFEGLCSDDGHDRFLRLMHDDGGGFSNYHVALFRTPDTESPFEWVITGRHVTLRTDGISCCGPIFYGHSRKAGNIWRYQAERADTIFKTLDDVQRARAFDSLGLPVGDLDGPQKAMVQGLIGDLLQPYRSFDESFPHDADTLRLRYFSKGDHASDGFHDIWKLEGLAYSWYYHGSPHVHVWLDVDRTRP